MKLTKIYIIFLLIVLIMAMMIIGGCQKKQILSTNQTETEVGVLNFNATLGEAQTATRAAESDNNVLKIASAEGVKPPHIVIETYTGVAGSSLQKYFSDELGYFKDGDYWEVNSRKKRFLPTGGMNLYAYFATDFGDRGDITSVEYIHPATTTDYPKLKFTPDATDALFQVDLIAAKVEKITEPNILIPFRHILSQINFGVKGLNRHQITISNIRLNGVKGSATFDYNSWSWTTDNNSQNYNYYFPDRTERGGGLGDNYSTQGTDNDSNNIYIFGDGGKFGPGTSSKFLYAQVDSNEKYKAADVSARLDNSLMLIPQEITKNSNATVTFDYKITIDGRVIRSGENQVVSLNAYYDWKPNLRYLYLFDFSDPSQTIGFSVLINEWQNWDSENQNTGVVNGTIQQPTAKTLNSVGDNETIYLLGLLERDLLWDWSNNATYKFDNINSLTLDFSGVQTRGYSVEVRVPDTFTLIGENPTKGGRLTIARNDKILLNPTVRELNVLKNNSSHTLYGTLNENIFWDWESVQFASLKQNESFTLNFSGVAFAPTKNITVKLPKGIVASGSGITGSNPYILSQATNITITNQRVDSVAVPIKTILDVLSHNSVVGVNGGRVAPLGDIWNWSGYTFPNLDPQESFFIDFKGVDFNSKFIEISLPNGFRGFSATNTTKVNKYYVATNERVEIKNNKINYPSPEYINALSGENRVELAGEKLEGEDALLDWSGYAFPNFSPQTSFVFDVTKIDFIRDLKLTLPPYFTLLGGVGVSGSNPYTLTQATVINIKNDRVPRPSNTKVNYVRNSNVIVVDGGKVLDNEVWDWSMLPFSSLGGRNNLFSVDFKNINFNTKYIEIDLSGFIVTGATQTNPLLGVHKISTNSILTFKDNRRDVTGGNPSLTDVVAGERVVLVGSPTGVQAWSWDQLPSLAAGEWFELDYSRLEAANGANYLFISLDGATYNVSGDYQSGWAYLFWKHPNYSNGIVRFTKK